MEQHALRYSAGYKAKKGYTFWEKDFDAMACKTMIRQLITKWGAMDTNLQKAVDSDSAVIKEDLTPTYVETEEPEIMAPPEEPEAPKLEEKAPQEPQKAEAPADAQMALFS